MTTESGANCCLKLLPAIDLYLCGGCNHKSLTPLCIGSSESHYFASYKRGQELFDGAK